MLDLSELVGETVSGHKLLSAGAQGRRVTGEVVGFGFDPTIDKFFLVVAEEVGGDSDRYLSKVHLVGVVLHD